jgi:quercetin dioxygenase-like cupin family protein
MQFKTPTLLTARRSLKSIATALLLLFAPLMPGAQKSGNHPHGAAAKGHTMVAPGSIKWNPAGSAMSVSVLAGSPETEGSPFVLRIRLAAGAEVPPHWHPIDEHVTVVSGTFHMGTGETADKSAAKAMAAGTYGMMPKNVRHFAWATEETVVQIHGIGPFKTFFVERPKK